MLVMAYPKLLSPDDILKAAVLMVEREDAYGLSLRAVAAAMGVKAPSLYRYFPNKDALEFAVAEEALKAMLADLSAASAISDPEARFQQTTEAYLRFARKRFRLYVFVMDRIPNTQKSAVGKAVWNVLLEAASGVSGKPDDTAAAVATWSFLHGYVTLEHARAFGLSGPKGGLELGLAAFLKNFGHSAVSGRTEHAMRATNRRKKNSHLRLAIAERPETLVSP